MDWFGICLLITRLEFEVFTFDMIFLGSSAKIPELLRFKTLGTLILNEEVVAEIVPVLTPTTFWTDPRVKTFPFVDIEFILLKTTSS